jgi:uncharacterized protein YdbL (DUF1318 family)
MKVLLAVVVGLTLAACMPHVVIEQNKPFDINVNFTGSVDVTVHAAQDMEAITGEKPLNKVRPEDIGLPPAGGPATSPAGRADAVSDPVAVAVDVNDELQIQVGLKRKGTLAESRQLHFVATTPEEAKAAMKARDPQVRALWDSKTVGESHTGLLVARGTLTADQQKLVDAENADRSVVYKAEAAAQKAQEEAVALIYYQARLGYAKQGAWYEKRNMSGVWEWKQWGM